jgi:carbon storage regulator
MLVLSRKKNESIVIGDNIVVKVVEIHGNRVRLGIEAPADVAVHRGEVQQRIEQISTEQRSNSAGTSSCVCGQEMLLA